MSEASVASRLPTHERAAAVDRHFSLDMIRGMCAIGVAIYHFVSWNLGIQIESLGGFGVYTFFVLSGATMMTVYHDQFRNGLSADSLRKFYVRRFARICPLLAVAALGAMLFARWQHGVGVYEGLPLAILTGSGMFALGPAGFLSNSVGAWSLGIEVAFYALFPLVALFAGNLRNLLITAAVLILAQQLYLSIISGLEHHWHYYIAPITFAPFFAFGILAHRLPLKQNAWNFPVALLLLVAIFSYSSIVPADLYRPSISYLLLMAATGGCVAFALSSSAPRPLRAPSIILGEISYALYLTHWFAEFLAGRIAGTNIGLKAVVFTLIAPALAYLVYRVLEVPARSAIRRLAGA